MRGHHVLIVSQSPVFRYGIGGVLEGANPDIRITEVANALDAVAASISISPTLVITQEALAGVSGIVAARALRERVGVAPIVVLADEVDDDRIVSAIGHGVDALLPSAVTPEEFLDTIAGLEVGHRPLTRLVIDRPQLAGEILAAVREAADGAIVPMVETIPGATLNGSEIAVLDGVIRGISSDEMAERLRVPRYMIKHHFTSVLQKLRATDRTTVLVSAARTGLLDLAAQLPYGASASFAAPPA